MRAIGPVEYVQLAAAAYHESLRNTQTKTWKLFAKGCGCDRFGGVGEGAWTNVRHSRKDGNVENGITVVTILFFCPNVTREHVARFPCLKCHPQRSVMMGG